MRPNRSTVSATRAAMSSSRVMSVARKATVSSKPPATAWPASALMSATMTRVPAAWNAATTPAPILVAPPGTMATFPSNPRMSPPRGSAIALPVSVRPGAARGLATTRIDYPENERIDLAAAPAPANRRTPALTRRAAGPDAGGATPR